MSNVQANIRNHLQQQSVAFVHAEKLLVMKPKEYAPAIRGVPEGCQEIPGYILDVLNGSAWITQDGQVTDKWKERGIWPTPEAAAEMMERCLSSNNQDDL